MADIRLRWLLDVVDKGGAAKVLRDDRAIRAGLKQTDAQYERTAATAASSSTRQASSLSRVATSTQRLGRITLDTAGETNRFAASQLEAIRIGAQAIATADKQTAALERQARAAKAAAAEEARRARVARTGAGSALAGVGAGAAGVGHAVRTGATIVGGGAVGAVGLLTIGGLRKADEVSHAAIGLSGLAGLKPREATALAVITQSLDINTKSLGQSFSTLGKQVLAYEKGSKSATEAFKAFGLSKEDVAKLKNNLPELIDTIFQASKKLPQAERAGFLKQVLGRGGTTIPLLEATGPITEQTRAVQKALGNVSPAELLRIHETEVKLKEITAGLELSFAQTFGPPLIKLMEAIIPAVKPVGEALKTAFVVPLKWVKDNGAGLFAIAKKAFQGEAPKPQKPLPGAPVTRPLVPSIGGSNTPLLTQPIGPRPLGYKEPVRNREPFSTTLAPLEREPSKLAQAAQKAGEVLRTVATDAQKYGKQFLDAFRPAEPFFKNILLPVLDGFGRGVLISFAIAIPVIRTAAIVLGKLGEVIGPLTPAVKGLGIALGVVLLGPALAKLSTLGKIGPLFSLMRLPIIAAGLALKGFGVGLTASAGLFSRLPGVFGRASGAILGTAGKLASGLGEAFLGTPKKLATIGREAGSALVGGLGSTLRSAKAAGARWAGAVAEGIAGLTGKARDVVSNLPLPGRPKGQVPTSVPSTVAKDAESAAKTAGEGAGGGFIAGWAIRLAGAGSVMLRALPWAALTAGVALFAFKLGDIFKKGFSNLEKIKVPRFQALEQIVGEFKKLPRQIAGVASSAARSGARIVNSIAGSMGGLPGKVAGVASRAGGAIVSRLGSWVDDAGKVGGRIASGAAHGIASLAGKIAGLGKSLFNSLWNLGRELVHGIVSGIKSLPGAIWDAIKGLAGKGAGLLGKVAGKLNPFRKGGHVRRYAGGGLVEAMVSPGEQIVYGTSSWTVPGPPMAADSVQTMLPVGAAVLTDDGQRRVAHGASIAEAVQYQAPHFAKGGFVSTAYGPPWGGIEGTGTTATGINLRKSPHVYLVAVDPSVIPLHSRLKINPNPFGNYSGPFAAEDTGGAIKGNRIDFYDWKGRADQNAWGVRNVLVTRTGKGGALPGAVGISKPLTQDIRLGASRTRAGLLTDVAGQGIEAGEAGLTPQEIARARRGARGARGNPIVGAIVEGLGGVTRNVAVNAAAKVKARKVQGAGGPSKLALGGTEKGGTFAGVRVGVANMAREVIKANPGLSVTSTTKGDHVSGSLHYQGRAVDVAGANMNRAADWLKGHYGRVLTEGIHNPNLSIKYGKEVPSSFWGPSVWAGHANHIHMALRRGGVVRRGFRLGGQVGAGIKGLISTAGTPAFGGAVAALESLLSEATTKALNRLTQEFTALARKRGPARVVKSFQAVITLAENLLEQRIGNFYDQIGKLGTQAERHQGQLDRSLRRQGIDPASTSGLERQIGQDSETTSIRRQQVERAKRAKAIADRTGNATFIATAVEKLGAAEDELDEAVTKAAEDQRALVEAQQAAYRQAAQEATDNAAFSLSSAQNAIAALEIGQRLSRTNETPGGLRQKAAAIESTLIPALQNNLAALNNQLAVLQQHGASASEIQAILSSIQTAGNEIGSALADVAELIRHAAEQAAEELVEKAGHVVGGANLGLQHEELEERINGTYETGGVRRAEYIRNTIIPAMQGEILALFNQYKVAEEQGNIKLAEQIAEQIAGKQNGVLEEILQANEDIADNTKPQHKVGGQVSFAYGQENVTDSLIAVGQGS
jgi:3D (Asp-Asp-Asp) domain-containing protein